VKLKVVPPSKYTLLDANEPLVLMVRVYKVVCADGVQLSMVEIGCPEDPLEGDESHGAEASVGVGGGGCAVHGDRAAGLDGQVGLVRRGGGGGDGQGVGQALGVEDRRGLQVGSKS
jgi:hypothetical protein